MSELVLPARWRGLQMRTIYMCAFAPLAYLGLVFVMNARKGRLVETPSDAWAIVLMVLTILGPVLQQVILKRAHIAKARKWNGNLDGVAMEYDRMVLIRCAMIESAYLFGLVWFFVSGDTKLLWYFFTVGLYFSIRRWPRKQEYFDFVLEAQAP